VADFVVPELGENVTGGDVTRVLVKPGDALKKDQPVLELETDKATIEVPSNVSGTVKEVKIKQGERVKVGGLYPVVAIDPDVIFPETVQDHQYDVHFSSPRMAR